MALTKELVWIHDITGAQYIPIHDYNNPLTDDRLQDLETFTFTMRADDPKGFAVLPDRIVSYLGRQYRIAELQQYRDGAKALVDVYTEALWMDLGKRIRAGAFQTLGSSTLVGLNAILLGSGWTGAVTPVTAGAYSMEDLDASVLTLLRRWAAITAREIEFDTVAKTVNFVTAVGTNRGIGFVWGHNLKQVKRRYQPPLATRLYAFGANNLDMSSAHPFGLTYIEDYTWYTDQGLTLAQAQALYRKDEVWVDTRYLLAVNLYDAAVRRMATRSQPIISYEMSVADFSNLTSTTADDVEIGDIVRVRDQSFDLDIITRVVRIEANNLRTVENKIELEYLQPGLLDLEDSSTVRNIDYGQMAVLVDKNDDPVIVNSSSVSIWAQIDITVAGVSTAVMGGTLIGAASGTGTVQIWAALDGTDIGARQTITFVDLQVVEFSWPTFTADMPEGSHTITWRVTRTAGSGTVTFGANNGRGWVLMRGAVGIGVGGSPNQLISEELTAITPATVVPEIVTVQLTTITAISVTETDAASTPASLAAEVITTLVV